MTRLMPGIEIKNPRESLAQLGDALFQLGEVEHINHHAVVLKSGRYIPHNATLAEIDLFADLICVFTSRDNRRESNG